MFLRTLLCLVLTALVSVTIFCVVEAGGESFLLALGTSENFAESIGRPFPALPMMGAAFTGMALLATRAKDTVLWQMCQ